MILAVLTTAALATTPNVDLRETVAEQPWRVAPGDRSWATAADVRFSYSANMAKSDIHPGFYHGGTYNELYGEVEPFENWILNLRLTTGVVSYSYGATAAGFVHPWPALTYRASGERLSVRGRAGDLDRQTLGAGLTLQDEELSGIRGVAGIEDVGPANMRAVVMWAGTGGFQVDGDARYAALEPVAEMLGVYFLDLSIGEPPFVGAYFRGEEGVLRWGLEGSRRSIAWAGLARIGVAAESDRLNGSLDVQGRALEPGWADGFRIEHDYLAPEQEDKQAFDTMHFLVDHRGGTMVGVDVAAGWLIVDEARLHGRYEVAELEGSQRPGLPIQHRFLAEVAFRPLRSPAIEAAAHLTNKSSAAISPPSVDDKRRTPAFSDITLLRIELRMQL